MSHHDDPKDELKTRIGSRLELEAVSLALLQAVVCDGAFDIDHRILASQVLLEHCRSAQSWPLTKVKRTP